VFLQHGAATSLVAPQFFSAAAGLATPVAFTQSCWHRWGIWASNVEQWDGAERGDCGDNAMQRCEVWV